MKKMLLIYATLGVLISACQKESENNPVEQVSFTIGMQLPQSGNMTRATASDLYNNFYTDYIATKVKLPSEYKLTIYKDEKEVATISGQWDADIATLQVGTYRFVGESEGDYEFGSLTFDQEITITSTTKTVDLTAAWDCYMLMFDKSLYKTVSLYHQDYSSTATTSKSLIQTDEIFYLFLPYSQSKYIEYVTHSGDEGRILLNQYSFTKGKYYAFDIVNGSISIPQMQQAD